MISQLQDITIKITRFTEVQHLHKGISIQNLYSMSNDFYLIGF